LPFYPQPLTNGDLMTTRLDQPHLQPAIGEVVEVYQKAGVAMAKIALRLCHIEVPMDLLDEAHLGDKILLEADVSLNRIEALYTNGFHAALEPDADGG
jgi:hypothetical protein